jgi:hypothetical protein
MEANVNPLADIVPLAKLPEITPHLATKDRCDYWLRMRRKNGAEAAGAIWTKDGIAYASLSRLGAWLMSPSRLLPKRGSGRAKSTRPTK